MLGKELAVDAPGVAEKDWASDGSFTFNLFIPLVKEWLIPLGIPEIGKSSISE